MSDIDTAVVDSLKVLDLERPIREAVISVRVGAAARDSYAFSVLYSFSVEDLQTD